WLSCGFLDRWVALGWAGCAALGPSGAGGAGFSGARYRGQERANPGKIAAYPAGGELGRVAGPFPGQALVSGQRPGPDQLSGAADGDRGPPVGLVRVAQRGGDPAQGGFLEFDGVLDIEPVDVGPPAQIQVRGPAGRAGPPQPQGLLHAAL